MTWFLVLVGGMQYIGPLPQSNCQMAATVLHSEGVICKQAVAMYTCDVPNRPGSYMACPKFEFPEVTKK